MNKNEVTQVLAEDRDIYLYEGDVDLSKYTYSIYENPNAQSQRWVARLLLSFKELVRNLAKALNL